MNVEALQQIITSGGRSFPIFIAFLKAKDVLKIAEVPNFSVLDTHHDLAVNVWNDPVKKWQRPLIESKKEDIIRLFNDSGEFMPNPVLLAENTIITPSIDVKNQSLPGGFTTSIKVLDIEESSDDKPLWIIDGQHRINGLGDPNCKQNEDYIPCVLLLNLGGDFYSGPDFAKLFAQVTTSATELKPLHKEWLEYAFDLDEYSKGNPSSAERKESMKTALWMCMTSNVDDSGIKKKNPFSNNIRFNDEVKEVLSLPGNQFDCEEITDIILKNYYNLMAMYSHGDHEFIGNQLALSFIALKKIVANPDYSVFFGKKLGTIKYSHKIMQNAFIIGVLKYLLIHVDPNSSKTPTEGDWTQLFRALNFHGTDWNFQPHVASGTGWVTKSAKLANAVLSYCFETKKLPNGTSDLHNYLLNGDKLFVDFEYSKLLGNGSVDFSTQVKKTYNLGSRSSENLPGHIHVRSPRRSINATNITIRDSNNDPNFAVNYNQILSKKGVMLPVTKSTAAGPYTTPSPIKFSVKVILYGGREESILPSLTW